MTNTQLWLDSNGSVLHNKVELIPSTRADLRYLFRYMRPSDIREMHINELSFQSDIRSSMMNDFDQNDCWTLWINDEIVCLGGIAPHPIDPRCGIIWLLGTKLADVHWREMTRFCRKFIATNDQYLVIGNILPTSEKKRVKWLKHLGFDIAKEKAEIGGVGYVHFEMFCPDAAPKTEHGSVMEYP